MLDQYSQAERKLIYRVLHAHLAEHPDLMDSELLHDLQTQLQAEAKKEAVDATDHGAWDAWLGNVVVPCYVRMSRRKTLE